MFNLYIIKDENFENWEAYEIYDCSIGRVTLRTSDWQKVVEFFNGNIPTPEIVMVD